MANGSKWYKKGNYWYTKRGNREIRGRRVKSSNRRNKTRSMSKAKLLDKKINTIFEARAQEIAKKEISKNQVHCCFRTFDHGTYVEATNAFTNLDQIGFNGSIHQVGQIPKDSSGIDLNLFTHRFGNTVKLDGISLTIRAMVKESQQLPVIEDSVLSYAIVACYDNWAGGVALNSPTIPECLPFRAFGYTSILDLNPDPIDNTRKIRTFIKGKVTLRATDLTPKVKYAREYYKFKNPLTLSWDPDEVDSDIPLRYRFYLILRSNIPQLDATDIKPYVATCCKFYFHQP